MLPAFWQSLTEFHEETHAFTVDSVKLTVGPRTLQGSQGMAQCFAVERVGAQQQFRQKHRPPV